MKYYIIDLERTLDNNNYSAYYWRSNACGYTIDKLEAGRFTKEEADKYCLEDFQGYTVMQPIRDK